MFLEEGGLWAEKIGKNKTGPGSIMKERLGDIFRNGAEARITCGGALAQESRTGW